MSSRSLAPTAISLLAIAAGCRSPGEFEGERATTTAAMPSTRGQRGFVDHGATNESAPVLDDRASAAIGAPAPDFELADIYGRIHRLSRYRGKIVVLEWFDPACPFVAYAYDAGPLLEMKQRYAALGVVWLSIHSVASASAALAQATDREFAAPRQLRTPILVDHGGLVGRAFHARTTPHLFVINERGTLVYSGALDNAPLGRVERAAAKTNFVETAIDDLRSGHAVTTSSTRPYGSAINYSRE
ncbi:MAG: redoxin domain-containing protein [Planctomycetes bacterium]|nr:redoxin domain-containing protein [Planctomycetota bacterium]